MTDVITIGKRLIARDQLAFIEPFDPARNPDFNPSKEFKTRLVLLNRENVLSEEEPRAFAETHGLRFLDDDKVGINPSIVFKVESFEPTEDFKPKKSFLTRLKWRGADGRENSKLLLAKPESVIALVSDNQIFASPSKVLSSRLNGRRPQKHVTSRKSETLHP